jgi:hypothetical protein
MPLERKPEYYKYVIKFMSYRDDEDYDKDHEFTPEELNAIQPEEIEKWMTFMVYGVSEPGPDDNPTLGRSSSLQFYKKALSYYMPNKLIAWNSISKTGNPTRSIPVNELIKRVKKKEVRKQGKASSARRPLEPAEFEMTLEMCNAFDSITRKYMVPAIGKFQYTMVARLDDTCRIEEADLKPNPQFPFALLCKMCWSKNVLEERDAPDQILLGSMDRCYCILLGLAIFLEVWYEAEEGLTHHYLFGRTGDPERTKKAVYQFLKKNIWDKPEFVRRAIGPVGTHSLRKYPSTRARRCGCSKDDVDNRGRWRKRRVQDQYVSVNLPYPDAKVAAALCVGGPCRYALKQGSGVSDNWLRQYVVPNILRSQHIQDRVALVLALPLVWAAFDNDMENYMPATLRNRIRTAYEDIRQLDIAENPVKKVRLVVTGQEYDVRIDQLFDDEAGNENNGQGNNNIHQGQGHAITQQEFQALYSQGSAMRHDFTTFQDDFQHFQQHTAQQFGMVNTNLRRIAMQPIQRPRAVNNAGQAPVVGSATLTPNPRNLHLLWHEYEFGLNGRKAAKDFTYHERGKNKYSYHRRKVVWDKIAELVRAGWTAQAAIDRIYTVYGANATVTTIINQMRNDRRHGGHPDLRV